MGTRSGQNIVTDGLILCHDAGNFKSFRGEPSTNLISGIACGYPTASNTWGTYEVFQNPTDLYNGGSPFTLTIGGVAGNEVTVTGHPFLTYDGVQPQSTGGGLTSGAVYFVKKTGANTFTLHVYDDTENGSKGLDAYGYAVHNSVNTDTRVSINSSGFPTSWWGPPHLPNTTTVKQIMKSGFKYEDKVHDCMRIHYFRGDRSEAGGMAYGGGVAIPTLAASTTYTISFYYRGVDEQASGKSVLFQIYCSDSTNGYANPGSPVVQYWDPGDTNWKRFTHTWTQAANQAGVSYFYWIENVGGAGTFAIDIAEIQLEVMGHVTAYTSGTRSGTLASGGGMKDLASLHHHEIVGNPVYNSDVGGNLVLDGSDDGWTLESALAGSPSSATVVAFFKSTDTTNLWVQGNDTGFYVGATDPSSSNVFYQNNCGTPTYYIDTVSRANPTTPVNYLDGNWHMWEAKGVNFSTWTRFQWWTYYAGYQLLGSVALVMVYNRSLSASESAQNFAALRNRFGI